MTDIKAGEQPGLFDRYMAQIRELDLFVEIAHAGLDAGQSAVDIHEVLLKGATQGVRRDDDLVKHADARRARAVKVRDFAEIQAKRGFPFLYNILTIRLWTILEYLVDNIVQGRLAKRESLANMKALESIEIPLVAFLSSPADVQNEIILNAVKQSTRSRLKIGIGRFESLLECVQLSGATPDTIKRCVLELSEVRNVLVHRDGLCDSRVVERCPWLGLKVGDRIDVSSEQFNCYRTLPGWYYIELHRRAKDIEAVAIPRAEQTLRDFEARLIPRYGRL